MALRNTGVGVRTGGGAGDRRNGRAAGWSSRVCSDGGWVDGGGRRWSWWRRHSRTMLVKRGLRGRRWGAMPCWEDGIVADRGGRWHKRSGGGSQRVVAVVLDADEVLAARGAGREEQLVVACGDVPRTKVAVALQMCMR